MISLGLLAWWLAMELAFICAAGALAQEFEREAWARIGGKV